jgi:hypothetical protein
VSFSRCFQVSFACGFSLGKFLRFYRTLIHFSFLWQIMIFFLLNPSLPFIPFVTTTFMHICLYTVILAMSIFLEASPSSCFWIRHCRISSMLGLSAGIKRGDCSHRVQRERMRVLRVVVLRKYMPSSSSPTRSASMLHNPYFDYLLPLSESSISTDLHAK